MTTPELPPLNRMAEGSGWVHEASVAARERILLARIAELQEEADRRTREVEATYHVQRTLRERIAELEADAARLDWLADQMRIADLHRILGTTPLKASDLRAAIDAMGKA